MIRATIPRIKHLSHAWKPANSTVGHRLRFSQKSWVPKNTEKLQEITRQSYIHQISDQQRKAIESNVPWFLNTMPASYFRQVPESLQLQHMKTVSAMRDFMNHNLSLKIELENEQSLEHTYISSQAERGSLHQQLKNLKVPQGYELTNVKVFSANCNELSLNIFSFEKTDRVNTFATKADGQFIFDYIEDVKKGKYTYDATVPNYNEALFNEQSMVDYLGRMSPTYAQSSGPRRFLIQRQLYEEVCYDDNTAIHIEPHHLPGSQYAGMAMLDTNHSTDHYSHEEKMSLAWISIASANVLPEVLMRLCSGMISSKHLNIVRAHLDTVVTPDDKLNKVTMIRMLVNSSDPAYNINANFEFRNELSRILKRAKWLDNETTDFALYRHPNFGIDHAEVLTALCSMLHGVLCKENVQAFASIKSILDNVESNSKSLEVARLITALFLDRFDPNGGSKSDADFSQQREAIQTKINLLQVDSSRMALSKMLDAVKATLRTNFHNDNRYALSLRVDPSIMSSTADKNRPAVPFGVFFVHGRNFNGFHCRFRDIARGGLRVVTPPNSDLYAIESSRQFDEVYGLSYGQQLKNKDIPEGGAKGVILVNTPVIEPSARFFAMRKAVKAFTDSMLDLIVEDSVKGLVDFYNKSELIYFGPDEQIIPSDIEWIVMRAAQRGYPIPAAFMSSKKDNGINHKVYGVTSEGVVVYLDVALRSQLKIDPKVTPFTVKITGGPDGDVAGNLIRILDREYGANCKIVGIADGFGVAEDPEGLDMQELLRLFHESKSIVEYDSTKTSSRGVVLPVTTDQGMMLRNTMHFRVKADAFIPAGGRPNTINADNYLQFFDDSGKPCSPLIVEGANIFITGEARKLLFERGNVTIVKDSSANKCGVITSSHEICASMLLSLEEFMEIKPQLVEDVLVKLRHLARLEGELLFRMHRNFPGDLPHFSERVSFAIMKVKDAILEGLTDIDPTDERFQSLMPLIHESLPKILVDKAKDRISTHFPVQYQRSAIASALASKIVYREGIHVIEAQPKEKIFARAVEYYVADMRIKSIIADLEFDLEQSELSETDRSEKLRSVEHWRSVIEILRSGGTRSVLPFF